MTRTIHGLFANDAVAGAVIADLEAAGFSHSDISFIASQTPRADDLNHLKVRDAVIDAAPDETLPGVGTAAGVGAASGATVGLMAALMSVTIPGFGPIIATGWLLSTLVGAAAGAATGGIIGVLTENGVSGEDATFYNDGIKNGGALVTLKQEEERASVVETIMNRHGRILPPGAIVQPGHVEEVW